MASVVTAPVHATVVPTRSPLALWHLLSLDAPTVAAVWTAFLAHCFGRRLPWTAPAALGLAVWLFYVADRIGDALRGSSTAQRHRFHAEHRRAFAAAATVVLPLLAALVVELPSPVREGWLLLAIPLALYGTAVHLLRHGGVPKEVLVGCFFAVATAVPALSGGGPEPLATVSLAATAFGLLCWLNCAAIARWEHTPLREMDRLTGWAACRLPAAAVALAGTLLAASAAAVTSGRETSLTAALPIFAAALSALLLALLHRLRERFAATSLRALADAALLTPLLVWPMATHAAAPHLAGHLLGR